MSPTLYQNWATCTFIYIPAYVNNYGCQFITHTISSIWFVYHWLVMNQPLVIKAISASNAFEPLNALRCRVVYKYWVWVCVNTHSDKCIQCVLITGCIVMVVVCYYRVCVIHLKTKLRFYLQIYLWNQLQLADEK